MDWYEIAGYAGSFVFLLLSGYFALKWKQAISLLKELGEAFSASSIALEDKKLTNQEAIELLKEWTDVMTAVLALVRKR